VFTFQLTDEMLSDSEIALFSGYLDICGVDNAVWDVYRFLPRIRSESTRPLILRAYRDSHLAGAAMLLKCRRYGGSLFENAVARRILDWAALPCHVWIRSGFCAETVANPGFVANGENAQAVIAAMLDFMRDHALMLLVIDRSDQRTLHSRAAPYPYVCDGSVVVSGMNDVGNYVARHQNLMRKVKEFRNRGGSVQIIHGALDEGLTDQFCSCLEATARRSVIRSPFQDLFSEFARATCQCDSPAIVHFIAGMKGDLLGYHSFVRTGKGLHMMHGAFARERPTTHHAYENIMIEAVRYALEQGLSEVHLGPVMNETKRRMVNQVVGTTLFFYSANLLLRALLSLLFPYTRLQSRKLLILNKNRPV